MPQMARLFEVMRRNYGLIMDASKNPLAAFPAAQSFQTMVYLSIMWTTIFCAGFGRWMWYGELVSAHVLVIFGIVVTSVTFSRAARQVRASKQR